MALEMHQHFVAQGFDPCVEEYITKQLEKLNKPALLILIAQLGVQMESVELKDTCVSSLVMKLKDMQHKGGSGSFDKHEDGGSGDKGGDKGDTGDERQDGNKTGKVAATDRGNEQQDDDKGNKGDDKKKDEDDKGDEPMLVGQRVSWPGVG